MNELRPELCHARRRSLPERGCVCHVLQSRPRYQADTQCWYSNEDTGVYFSFDFDPQTEQPEDWPEVADQGEEWQPTVATFTLNFNRPGFFGLEAAPEVAAYVKEFDLIVDDPQIDGMGRGPFSIERFLAGWNKGNRWASAAVRRETPAATHTYPGEKLNAIWASNYEREARQTQLGDGVFVPKISFGAQHGIARSFCVWPDAIPAFLPEVDVVLIIRDQLARRRWFRKEQELVLAPWPAIRIAAGNQINDVSSLPYIRLEYAQPPASLVSFVRREWPGATKENFPALGPDSVLDAEFFSPESQG